MPQARVTYAVWAVHPKPDSLPVSEVCLTPLAATIRAGQLHLAGYRVEITVKIDELGAA
jgi:hypothetical protein